MRRGGADFHPLGVGCRLAQVDHEIGHMRAQRLRLEKSRQTHRLLRENEGLFAGVEHHAARVGHARGVAVRRRIEHCGRRAPTHGRCAVCKTVEPPEAGRLMRVVGAISGNKMRAHAVEQARDPAGLRRHEAQGAGAEPGFAFVIAGRADQRVVRTQGGLVPAYEMGLRALHAKHLPPRAVDGGWRVLQVDHRKLLVGAACDLRADQRMADQARPGGKRLAAGEHAVLQAQRFAGQGRVPDAEGRAVSCLLVQLLRGFGIAVPGDDLEGVDMALEQAGERQIVSADFV